MNAQWLGGFGSETASLLKEYAAISEGLTYPYPYDLNSELPSVRAFIAAYQTKYGELPDNSAANAYDALKVLSVAIAQSGESPVNVKSALVGIQNYAGGSGLLSFDANGNVQKEILIKQVKDGKFVRVQ